MEGSAPAGDDPRKAVRKSRTRQHVFWSIVLGSLFLLLALYSGGFFLYPVAAVSLLLLFSMGLAAINLIGIRATRSLSDSRVKWGGTVEATLTVSNRKPLSAPWLFWEDYVDSKLDVEGPRSHSKSLGPNGEHDLTFRLHSTRRGFFRIGPTVVESSGPFGLMRRFLVGPKVDFITVLPRVVPVDRGLRLGQRPIHQVPRRRSVFEDPCRFMGVRDYQPGDSLRRIHWKATARSRRIQVKLFEPAVLTGALLAVEMNHAAYGDRQENSGKSAELLETAMTTAASLCEFVLTGDQRVGLISNGGDAAERYPDDWKGGIFRRSDQVLQETRITLKPETIRPVEVSPGKGAPQLERIHDALARLVFTDHVSLPELLQVELPRLPHSLVLMIVTPSLDRALDDTLGSLQRSGIETAVIWICDPEEQLLPEAAVSHRVPVYPVRGDSDIMRLGAQSL
jgi:uncharacterized protein (DUF58 family)